MLRILSLCDNIVDDKKCWAAEGISLFISYYGTNILFDTGRSIEVLLHNLAVKSIDINSINYIVLSHGHKGHIGAIGPFLEHLSYSTTVVFGKGIENQKYNMVNGKGTLDSSVNNADIIKNIKNRQSFVEVNESFSLTDRITILANIPLVNKNLTTFSNKYMVINKSNHNTDLFPEELALCVDVGNRILIISGCSHRGINNIVSCAQALFPQKSVLGIIGGLHTKDDEQKTEELIDYLSNLQIDIIVPCHCTGIFSRAKINASIPDKYHNLSTGETLEIEGSKYEG